MNALVTTLASVSCLVPLILALPRQELEQRLKDRDPAVRVAAVVELDGAPTEDAEKLLQKALRDDDWEVVERAADALARHGGERVRKDLLSLALEAPPRRLRAVALRSFLAVGGEGAFEELLSTAKGRGALRGAEAVAEAARLLDGPLDTSKLDRLLEEEDGDLRAAAARALVHGDPSGQGLVRCLALDDVRVRAAALEAAVDQVGPVQAAAAVAMFAPPAEAPKGRREAPRVGLPDVLARRALWLLAAGASQAEVRATYAELPAGRGAELALLLLEGEPAEELRAAAAELLARAAAADPAADRALAAAGLERLATAEAGATLRALLADGEARVRLRAARALGRGFPFDQVREPLSERLQRETEADVRLELCVQLGRREARECLAPLVAALADADWRVSAVAAVSLGKLALEGAILPLEQFLARSTEDWRRRAAAVVGLGELYRADALRAVVGAVADGDPTVARTAHEVLRKLSRRLDIPADAAAWQQWYAEFGDTLRPVHPADDAERRDKYGYEVPDSEIYRGLDVVVLQSRGDHIEQLLGRLEIEHRLTSGGRVTSAGVHPEAIFVANCTGEITPEDAVRLQWFVLTGGQLFGSCWALTHTIGPVAPGVLAQFPTASEVLDDVPAYPCSPHSPFLTGVFPEAVRPIYHLEGSHLVRVLAPERCEVLIDSPEAAARWGEGNLAAWFEVGHGLILDSANHFDLQGLEVAPGLEDALDRQAYAVDHLGYDYAQLRELSDPKVWKSNSSASKQVPDLSAFRFLTNFVRRKRAGE
jgi:HEAT repeat protein